MYTGGTFGAPHLAVHVRACLRDHTHQSGRATCASAEEMTEAMAELSSLTDLPSWEADSWPVGKPSESVWLLLRRSIATVTTLKHATCACQQRDVSTVASRHCHAGNQWTPRDNDPAHDRSTRAERWLMLQHEKRVVIIRWRLGRPLRVWWNYAFGHLIDACRRHSEYTRADGTLCSQLIRPVRYGPRR